MNVLSNPYTSSPVSDAPTSTGLSVAEILREAATYLMRHGWTQGAYYANTHRPNPKACALGAIAIITGDEPDHEPVSEEYVAAVDVLDDYLNLVMNHTDGVGSWNDHPYRTAAQVVAALSEAATWWETPPVSCRP